MNKRQLAQTLINAHQERSWREISQQDYFGLIPAGTLARIASTNGDYIPDKWRPWLGMGRARKVTHTARRISEMKPGELLFAFENRVDA